MSEQNNSSNNKRIAKNTILMYFRMFITMSVQLYTSRVILENLGVTDYGIYSIVGSFIVMFTFISGPLEAATQRFMTFELGRGNENRINVVFNMSMFSHILLALCLALVIELAGIWYINNKMQMPVERLPAALWTFHFSVFALTVNLCKTPFSSLIVAYERMSYYAYVSIIDVALKLLSATALAYFAVDKLKLYAVNITLVSIIGFIILWIYCKSQFKQIKLLYVWDRRLFKDMTSFSGWTMFGSVASMTSNQGLNILLNYFFGVVVNAAMGIATQVSSAVNQFVENFQIAFRPQIVKYYAAGDKTNLYSLMCNATKISTILFLAIACPVMFNIEFLLEIWLKNPPGQTGQFTIMFFLMAYIATLAAPLVMVVQATGTIKKYQMVVSSCIMLTILFSVILLNLGVSAITVLFTKLLVDMLCYLVRLLFVRKFIRLSIRYYTIKALLPNFRLILISILYMLFVNSFFYAGWIKLITTTLLFFIAYIPLVLYLGFNKSERMKVCGYIFSKVNRYRV